MAMMQSLPTGGFEWVEDPSSVDVTNLLDDADEGYFLEVDLHYPEHLHDTHSDFPLAPEKKKICKDQLSPYSTDLLQHLGRKHVGNIPKLVPDLTDKVGYVIHSRALKQCLALGLEVTKVHRVLKFQQSPWLRPYIEFNTEKRKAARSDFEKDLWKLLNNAVFGKTMEDQRKHVRVVLCNDPKKFKKQIAKPTFHRFRIFNEGLVAVEMRKGSVLLSKPIYVGAAILDVSKTFMYDFHYNHMVRKYGSRCEVCFSDTDSLFYHIQTEDVYKDMKEDAHLYDLSDYAQDHFLHSTVNKKVPGKFKDEISKGIPEEMVGLRPKCYSVDTSVGDKQTCKGVSKTAKKRSLQHQRYKDCLFQKVPVFADMHRIQAKDHKLYTVHVNKLALSPADDKRYILSCGVRTLAYGHYLIPLIENNEMDWGDL